MCQAVSRPGEVPQLVRAYFELLFRFLLFCPAALLGSPELDTALRLVVACVGAADLERESARAVLVFLGQLAGRCGGQLDMYQAKIEVALAPHGEGLTRLIFAALAVSDGFGESEIKSIAKQDGRRQNGEGEGGGGSWIAGLRVFGNMPRPRERASELFFRLGTLLPSEVEQSSCFFFLVVCIFFHSGKRGFWVCDGVGDFGVEAKTSGAKEGAEGYR